MSLIQRCKSRFRKITQKPMSEEANKSTNLLPPEVNLKWLFAIIYFFPFSHSKDLKFTRMDNVSTHAFVKSKVLNHFIFHWFKVSNQDFEILHQSSRLAGRSHCDCPIQSWFQQDKLKELHMLVYYLSLPMRFKLSTISQSVNIEAN